MKNIDENTETWYVFFSDFYFICCVKFGWVKNLKLIFIDMISLLVYCTRVWNLRLKLEKFKQKVRNIVNNRKNSLVLINVPLNQLFNLKTVGKLVCYQFVRESTNRDKRWFGLSISRLSIQLRIIIMWVKRGVSGHKFLS